MRKQWPQHFQNESRVKYLAPKSKGLCPHAVYFIYNSLQILWIPPLFPVIWSTLELAGSFSFFGYALSPLFLSLFFIIIKETWYANPTLFNKSPYWLTGDRWIILNFMPVCLVFRVKIVTPEGCFHALSSYRVYQMFARFSLWMITIFFFWGISK